VDSACCNSSPLLFALETKLMTTNNMQFWGAIDEDQESKDLLLSLK